MIKTQNSTLTKRKVHKEVKIYKNWIGSFMKRNEKAKYHRNPYSNVKYSKRKLHKKSKSSANYYKPLIDKVKISTLYKNYTQNFKSR